MERINTTTNTFFMRKYNLQYLISNKGSFVKTTYKNLLTFYNTTSNYITIKFIFLLINTNYLLNIK